MRQGKVRELIFVEGLRLAEDLAQSSLRADEVFFTEKFAASERGAELLKRLAQKGFRAAAVSEKIAAVLGATVTPQGIFITAEKPLQNGELFIKNLDKNASGEPLIVVLHEINNPSNVGAILRSANAVGAHGAILTKNCADVFAPKSLRASMGACFRMNLWTNADFFAAVEMCREKNLQIAGASVQAVENHCQINWRKGSTVFLGSEANGFQTAEIEHFDTIFRIPMANAVESLNVAASAAVIFYEAARQRQFCF